MQQGSYMQGATSPRCSTKQENSSSGSIEFAIEQRLDTVEAVEMALKQSPKFLLSMYGMEDRPSLNFEELIDFTKVARSTSYTKWDKRDSAWDPDYPVRSQISDAFNSPLTFDTVEAIRWKLIQRLKRLHKQGSH